MRHILRELVLAVFGVAGLAGAQTPTDFQALAATVQPGDRVVVAETSGRKYSATIIETSPSTLTVTGRRQRPPRVLTPRDIAKVDRPDPVVNGVLIGMAGGVATAIHRRLYIAPLPPGTIRLGLGRRGAVRARRSPSAGKAGPEGNGLPS